MLIKVLKQVSLTLALGLLGTRGAGLFFLGVFSFPFFRLTLRPSLGSFRGLGVVLILVLGVVLVLLIAALLLALSLLVILVVVVVALVLALLGLVLLVVFVLVLGLRLLCPLLPLSFSTFVFAVFTVLELAELVLQLSPPGYEIVRVVLDAEHLLAVQVLLYFFLGLLQGDVIFHPPLDFVIFHVLFQVLQKPLLPDQDQLT